MGTRKASAINRTWRAVQQSRRKKVVLLWAKRIWRPRLHRIVLLGVVLASVVLAIVSQNNVIQCRAVFRSFSSLNILKLKKELNLVIVSCLLLSNENCLILVDQPKVHRGDSFSLRRNRTKQLHFRFPTCRFLKRLAPNSFLHCGTPT